MLQNLDSVGGGFYSLPADTLVGNFYPNGQVSQVSAENTEIPNAEHQAVLEVARNAAHTRKGSESVINNPAGLFLISAMPVQQGDSIIGSAWAVKRIADLPGANRFRAYLIAAGLAATTLASVLLTLLVIRNLQGGVRKVESGLQTLENNLSTHIDTTDQPAEIQRIIQAINRLGNNAEAKDGLREAN